MSTQHVYRSLKKKGHEIRLLYLDSILSGHKDGREQQISGRLEYVNLLGEQSIKYMALSYVWGDPDYTSSVFLDDDSFIPITSNLLDALVHIFANGHAPGPLPIWIDAVCINQADDIEKSWQVQQMGEIYSRAETTLIFLGSGDAISDEAMDLLFRTGQQTIDHGCFVDPMWLTSSNVEGFADKYHSGQLSGISDHSLQALIKSIIEEDRPQLNISVPLISAIMDKPWWHRTWVLQEFLLSPAPVFICGHRSLTANRLVATLYLFLRLFFVYQELFDIARSERATKYPSYYSSSVETSIYKYSLHPAIGLYMNNIYCPEIGISFVDLFTSVQLSGTRLNATDPRDYVYALLGLVSSWEVEDAQMQADYSLTLPAVYTQTALSLLRCKYFGIFALAVTLPASDDMPSWAPNWSSESSTLTNWEMRTCDFAYAYKLRSDGKHVLSILGSTYRQITKFWLDDGPTEPPISHTTSEDRQSPEPASNSDMDSYLAGLRNVPSWNVAEKADIHLKSKRLATSMLWRSRHFQKSEARRLLDLVTERTQPDDDKVEWTSVVILSEILADPNSPYLEEITKILNMMNDILRRESPSEELISRASLINLMAQFQSGSGYLKISPSLRDILETHRSKLNAFYDAMICVRRTRREYALFLCEDGHVGVGTKKLQKGDILARIGGYEDDLFILRPAGGDCYRLVGVAYVAQILLGDEVDEGVRTQIHLC